MLFMEIIAAYSENRKKPKITICCQMQSYKSIRWYMLPVGFGGLNTKMSKSLFF
jgi:hypothetical protein